MFPSKKAKSPDEEFSYTHFNDQNLADQTGWRAVNDHNRLGDGMVWFLSTS